MSVALQDRLAWVTAVTGGECIDCRPAGSGASRFTYLVDVRMPGGDIVPLVLRTDTGDGPLSGTEISLAREAAIYRALQGRDIPIAPFRAVADDGLAVLLGRAAGTAEYAAASPEDLAALTPQFASAFARLHALKADELDIPGLRPVRGPRDHALNELDLWEGIFKARVRRPAAVVRFTFDWMRRHAPECDEVVLCHGDVGPGNFMFDGPRLTALIDWEFAHFGDPMDDLAWMNIRGSSFAGWPIDDLFRLYQQASGRVLDRRRIAYYQLFVLLRMAVSCQVAIDNRKGGMNANVYFTLLPALEMVMPLAIATLEGLDVPELAPPDEAPYDEVGAYVERELLPAVAQGITDPLVRFHLLSGLPLMGHVHARLAIGAEVDAACLDAIARVTGVRYTSWTGAERALDDVVARRALTPDALLPLLVELSVQRARLWPGHPRMQVPGLPAWIA